MAKEKYKRFTAAVVEWLEAIAALVTLTGHNVAGGANNIRVVSGEDTLPAKFCGVVLQSTIPFSDESDGGPYTTDALVLCRNITPTDTLDMLGAIQEEAERSAAAPYNDETYSNATIKIQSIRFLSAQEMDIPGEAGQKQYEKIGLMRLRWIEV
jgi:hypothetical protein